MELHIDKNTVVVFDLDDTLYQEIDYLKSAYRNIANSYANSDIVYEDMMVWYFQGDDVFQRLLDNYITNHNKLELVKQYQNHFPNIVLNTGVDKFIRKLQEYKITIGIITDGRSVTQRNKIAALGLKDRIDEIVISEELGSEKPNFRNYEAISQKYFGSNFIYISDNPEKDFITPNQMGWNTIGIRDEGDNIHPQDMTLDREYQPHVWVNGFEEITLMFC